MTTMITIYKITNRLNWKIYVGQTCQSIEKHFIQHSKADSPLGQAMQDCGLDNFTIEVIEECETVEQANERERFCIQVLKSKMPNGYNRTNGGEVGIHKPRIISLNREVSDMEKSGIGKMLRERRNELSLTQRQVANYVGVTEATVSRWESGDIDNMRRDKIASLAAVLRMSPLLIMGDDSVLYVQVPPTSYI